MVSTMNMLTGDLNVPRESAMTVLLDIVLRQLGHSFGGTDEISGYVMAIATSWGMGYALMELGHVRIDLIRSRVGGLGRALFDLFAMLALSGTVTLIAIRAWPVVERSLANSSRANTPLETPLALVQIPWFAGWLWFAIVSWLTFVAALIRPGAQHRVDQGGQRDGEKHAPETPHAAENQDRYDNRDRVQVNHFGKQQRHQQVTIQRLQYAVGKQDPAELGTPAPLEPGDDGDRQRHHRGTDIGNHHRQADHGRQQQ